MNFFINFIITLIKKISKYINNTNIIVIFANKFNLLRK